MMHNRLHRQRGKIAHRAALHHRYIYRLFTGIIRNTGIDQVDGHPLNRDFTAPPRQSQADNHLWAQLFNRGNELLAGQTQHASQLTYHHLRTRHLFPGQSLRDLP
ncbi:hypothetical protein D3C78_1715380 [compost metagenome]